MYEKKQFNSRYDIIFYFIHTNLQEDNLTGGYSNYI